MDLKDFRNVKVGDKVRLRSKRPSYWNGEGLMDHYLGAVVTVAKIDYTIGLFEIVEDDRGDQVGLLYDKWCFDMEDIVEVVVDKERPQQIVIKTDGKKTVTAYCGDTFDLYTGARLALDRLFGADSREVREVKRKAKVGEYIKIVAARGNTGFWSNCIYENGDIIEVIGLRELGVRIATPHSFTGGWLVYDSEYVVLENYKPEETK